MYDSLAFLVKHKYNKKKFTRDCNPRPHWNKKIINMKKKIDLMLQW